MATVLELNCRLTESDLRQFFAKQFRVRTWASGVVAVSILGYTIYLLIISSQHRTINETVLILGPCLLLSLLAAHFCFVDSWISARDTLKNSPSLREARYEFSSEGFTCSQSLGNSHTAWAAIVKASESEEMFLLYLQNRAVFMIPKANFAGEAQVGQMRDLLRRSIGGRAQLMH